MNSLKLLIKYIQNDLDFVKKQQEKHSYICFQLTFRCLLKKKNSQLKNQLTFKNIDVLSLLFNLSDSLNRRPNIHYTPYQLSKAIS